MDDIINEIVLEENIANSEQKYKNIRETKNNIIPQITDSNLQTKKKSFVSEINPNLIKRNIQKAHYIWFGVYDQLMRNTNMVNLIKKCTDTSLPLVQHNSNNRNVLPFI